MAVKPAIVDRIIARFTFGAVAVYCLAICAIVGYRARSTDREAATLDFRDFWLTAREFFRSGRIRDDLGVHNYPPIFTILMTPFGVAPLQPAAVMFTLFSIAIFAWSLWSLSRSLGVASRGPIALATLAALPYIHATLVLGQVNLITAGALIAGLATLPRFRSTLTGVFIALAAVIKIMPALLVGLLVLRGRVVAAIVALTLIATIGFGLPIALLGANESRSQYVAFFERAAAGHSARATIAAEKPQKAKYSNVAVPMVLRRLLTGVDAAPGAPNGPMFVNVVDWPTQRVWWVYVTLAALIALTTVSVTVRLTWFHATDSGSATVALYGAWSAAALLASPLVWTHHLAMAFPTVFALAFHALGEGAGSTERHSASKTVRRVAIVGLIGWLVAAATLISPEARAAGGPMWGVLFAWVCCLIVAFQTNASQPLAAEALA